MLKLRMTTPGTPHAATSSRLYDVNANDPDSALVDRSEPSVDEVAGIGEGMAAHGRRRYAQQVITAPFRPYTKPGSSDMRALHFLIVARHSGAVVTPSAIAAHLKISTASTTKLLDRLEAGGHIRRDRHPTDRRALAITVTDETREAAMQTVGRVQAKR